MAKINVIIPAYNSQDTIEAAVVSVIAQDEPDWQLLVIDDGSTDRTADCLEKFVDPRIRIIRQENVGLSGARNRGIAEADARYILFLDADDTIEPTHLANLLAAISGRENTVGYSGYRRITRTGLSLASQFPVEISTRPFVALSFTNGLATHCLLVPRTAFARVGLFDEILPTCEDWDMWARLARAGYTFSGINEPTAIYRMRAGSLSRDFKALAVSALEVLSRCRRSDPRVSAPDPTFAEGYSGDLRVPSAHFLLWCLTAAAANDRAFDVSFESVQDVDLAGEAKTLVTTIKDALTIGSQNPPSALARIWNRCRKEIVPQFDRLLANSSEVGLRHRVIYALERDLIRDDPLETPVQLELVGGVRYDIARLHPLLPALDLIHLRLFSNGKEVLREELPSWLAPDSRGLLDKASKAVGQDLKGQPMTLGLRIGVLKDRFTRPARENQLAVEQRIRDQIANIEPLSVKVEATATFPEGSYDEDYWECFFTSQNPWQLDDPFETRKYALSANLIAQLQVTRALELGCAEGHFTETLAALANELVALDISATALDRTRDRLGDRAHLSYLQRDLADGNLPGGFDLVVCSETLYYLGDEEALERAAIAIRGSLAKNGWLLSSHSRMVADRPGRTAFDWGFPFGADRIAQIFERIGGLQLERSIENDLYRIDLWRKSEDTAPALLEHADPGEPRTAIYRTIRWDGIVERAEDLCETMQTRSVPVLMYHSVCNDGPAVYARYRVSPDAFEAQLRLLRRRGFYRLSSAEFDWYRQRGEPIPGRPVILTFDDGYRDFHDVAWPILNRNAFSADVFVVVGKVGGMSDWERALVPPQELMDWSQIAELNASGVGFGSHLMSHRHVDAMSSKDLFDEALRSRLTLERKLGVEVRAIAAPSGGLDERAIRTFDAAGYHVCYSTREGIASIDEHSLNLPRIEVRADTTLEVLSAAVGLS